MYEKTRLLDSFCYFCESLHGIMDERRKIEEPVSAEFERFNKDFEASLRSETTRLQSAIDVILNSTGKHVRPLLVLLTAKVCGQVTDNTINSAVLLELLHTATLIHDDVIDETKQRRGVPSLNAIFDNRISVLVGDYVLSTNETHTVREFVEEAFREVGIEVRWEGQGVNEKGYDSRTGRLLVDVNPEFYRPAEVEFLWGDCSKAEKELNWKRKVDFRGLVAMMMNADMQEIVGMSCEEFRNRNR